MGRAEALLGAARAFLDTAITEVVETLDAEDAPRMKARLQLRLAGAHVAESSASIVQSLASEAGAAVIFEKHGMERVVRDVHAAVKHIAMNPYAYVMAGKMRFGIDLGASRF